jgi:surfactin synthase thioesterase subunit
MPDWIELMPLHLPGRGFRYGEPPVHDWPSLVDLLLKDVQRPPSRPFAIFGHSMGALVGVELACAIRDHDGREPIWFGASGCAAPNRHKQDGDWLRCSDETLVKELRSRNGTPAELLENRELLELALPAIRADFHLCGTYKTTQRRPLGCPILVLSGAQDEMSTPRENLTDWGLLTSRQCRVETLPGDHFFIDKERERVVALVVDSLNAALSEVMVADV